MQVLEEMMIATRKGGKQVPVLWKGDRFAVTPDLKLGGYAVTHIKSGYRVSVFYRQQWKAQFVAQRMDAEPILKALNVYEYGQQSIDPHPAVVPLMPRINFVVQRIQDEVSAIESVRGEE